MEETRELRDRMATLEAGTRVRAQWAADADSSLKEKRESIESLRAKVEEARQEAAAAQAKVEEQEEADRRAHEERSVELRVQVAESLRLTSLSAAQLQQVLVDLVVRRRDLLPSVRSSVELLLGPDPHTVDVGADGSVSDGGGAAGGHPEDDPDEEVEEGEEGIADKPQDPVDRLLDDVEREAEPSDGAPPPSRPPQDARLNYLAPPLPLATWPRRQRWQRRARRRGARTRRSRARSRRWRRRRRCSQATTGRTRRSTISATSASRCKRAITSTRCAPSTRHGRTTPPSGACRRRDGEGRHRALPTHSRHSLRRTARGPGGATTATA